MKYALLRPSAADQESIKRRARPLTKGAGPFRGPVLYWMSRAQRVRDNWALLFAQASALAREQGLAVCFCLSPRFLDAAWRQYDFMIQGLKTVSEDLKNLRIPFFLLWGDPGQEIPRLIKQESCGLLVTDFDPLRLKLQWEKQILESTALPIYQVDGSNIVPAWIASPKREYAAYTFRPKVLRLLPEYLEVPQEVVPHPYPWPGRSRDVDWETAAGQVTADPSVSPVSGVPSGEEAARRRLEQFAATGLDRYAAERNDPNSGAQSGLSPYLHFGQISSLRVAIEVLAQRANGEALDDYLEELITRRELSDNFCLYCVDYDNTRSFPEWARKTLDEHLTDERPHLYSNRQLEDGETHDELWNAAQLQLVVQGTIPGYLRMYWAKKILEWSETPEAAMERAIYLNDRYQLDGRDPNGYAGIAWSIGGVHDRAWPSRPVFGKIRFMSYNGCRSKFKVDQYVRAVREPELLE